MSGMLYTNITPRKMTDQRLLRLVSRSCALQQGEKSVLTYANELCDIYRELGHYHLLNTILAGVREGGSLLNTIFCTRPGGWGFVSVLVGRVVR